MADSSRPIDLFDIDLTLIDHPFNEETVSGALDAATGVAGLLKQLDWHGTTDGWLADEGCGERISDPDICRLVQLTAKRRER